MITWFFNMLKRREYRSQSHLPFAVTRSTKEVISSYILEIMEQTERGFAKLKEQHLNFNALKHQEVSCYYHKDEFGVVEKYQKPLFSHGLIKKYKSERTMYMIGLFIFLLVETALFYMIAQNISGGLLQVFSNMGRHGEDIAMIIFSLLFATISAFLLDTGLEKVYTFLQAKEHYRNKKITWAVYTAAVYDLAKGIILILMVIAILVALNKARSFAIDSSASAHNPGLVLALILISVAAGIWMGVAKRVVKKAMIVLSLNNKWEKTTMAMEKLHVLMAKESEDMYSIKSKTMIKAYQLTLDLQEIYGKEYDDRDEALMQEYRDKMINGTFELNDLSVWQYQNLSSNEYQLLAYQMHNNERLNYIYSEVAKIISGVASSEDARMNLHLIITNQDTVESEVLNDPEVDKSVKELMNQ